MATSPIPSGLPDALASVRRAYRLLWLYQQTLIETYTEILQHLKVKHYHGELDTLQRSTDPAPKPPGTFLPLLRINTLYLNSSASSEHQQPDDYMVDLLHIGDTGYQTVGYPTDAPPVSMTSTELSIFVFHSIGASSVNWYNAIWRNTAYPAHDSRLVSQVYQTIQAYGYRFDLATLTNRGSIATQMAHFKGRVLAELGLQL